MSLKIKIPKIIKEENIQDIINGSIIRFGDRYGKPEPIVNYIEGVTEVNYLSYSGLSAIMGKQKSRKTFYLSVLMSSVVGSALIDGKIKGYAEGKINLWFDTEQSKYFASRIPYRIVKKVGIDSHPENLKFLSIKKYDTVDRIRIIEYFMENTKNLGLVIIDGLRDLVRDFNNLSECTDILNKIMSWVDTTGCHICVVLHINPLKKGDEEKPRGHLGTELQNKVESSIIIEKSVEDPGMSIIKPRDFRDKDIGKFGMRVDDHGIPYLVDYDENNNDEF